MINHFNVFASFHNSKLNEKEKTISSIISKGWLDYRNRIQINQTVDGIDFQKIMTAIISDIPELFYVDLSKVSVSWNSKKINIEADFVYPLSFCERIKTKVWETIFSFQTKNKSKSDIEQLVNSFLKENIKYGIHDNADAAYSIKGVFYDGLAVCDGFAKSFKLLCDAFWIPCIYVQGYASNDTVAWERHAWNIVNINNKNYHVDSTWEATTANGYGIYLNASDGLISKNHRWDKSLYPKCNFQGLFERNLVRASTCQEIDNLLIRFNKREIDFVCCQVPWSFESTHDVMDFISNRFRIIGLSFRDSFQTDYFSTLNCFCLSRI